MSRKGFTLMELVVVLVVISLVMLLVIPRLPSTEGEDLKISARTLASTLRYMHDRAATGRTTLFLRLEPGTDKVVVLESAADGSEKQPEDNLLQKRPTKEGIIIADVMVPRLGKLKEGQVRLDVGPGGMRDFAVIHLQSGNGAYWTVMAFPSSGKVKLYEGYQDNPL